MLQQNSDHSGGVYKYIAQWTFCDYKMKIMEKHVKEIRLRNIYIIRVPTNMSDFDL